MEMRNLIVCADGTWNTPDQEDNGIPVPTNVVRLYNCLAHTDNKVNGQRKYYHPGVGTEGGIIDKLMGGGLGAGLGKNVMSAYRWLGSHYHPGDRIFLFGFSRGAYTVRSVGGMIGRCGMLNLRGLPDKQIWGRVEKAYADGYRNQENPEDWASNWEFHQGDTPDGKVPIYFIGVWDTVGALGIPDNLGLLNLLDNREDFVFHNTKLGNNVIHARHAVAIDEKRASFAPTLWQEGDNTTDVKQVWFSGVHADVGGGYAETGLSDLALKWMIDEAADSGLGFREKMVAQIETDNYRGVLHNSHKGIFSALQSRPRNIPKITETNTTGIHSSVLNRSSNPPIAQAPYRPTREIRSGDDSVTISVYADQPWNQTNIYLEKGVEYVFTAEGEWLDHNIPCDPDGRKENRFRSGEILYFIGKWLGKAETLFRRITGNKQAEFTGTRRYEEYPWFALIGVIAKSPPFPREKLSNPQYKHFYIGKEATKTLEESGYFYCFANDAWNFYSNNHGRVQLTITRN